MALTATASQGFEFVRYVAEDEVLWVAGDPGDTYTRGDLVTGFTAGEGHIDPLAADETPVGVVLDTVICPSLATGFPVLGESGQQLGWGQKPDEDARLKTLVAIRPLVACGTPVHKVTFSGQYDDTVITYTAATPQVALTTGCGADDRPNGAFVYVYEGAGAGQWNLVADYDHTGGAVELMLVFHRAFHTAVDSTSKLIILAGEAQSDYGMGFFGRSVGDHNNILTTNGANDGDWVFHVSAPEVPKLLRNLMMQVVPATSYGLFA